MVDMPEENVLHDGKKVIKPSGGFFHELSGWKTRTYRAVNKCWSNIYWNLFGISSQYMQLYFFSVTIAENIVWADRHQRLFCHCAKHIYFLVCIVHGQVNYMDNVYVL